MTTSIGILEVLTSDCTDYQHLTQGYFKGCSDMTNPPKTLPQLSSANLALQESMQPISNALITLLSRSFGACQPNFCHSSQMARHGSQGSANVFPSQDSTSNSGTRQRD